MLPKPKTRSSAGYPSHFHTRNDQFIMRTAETMEKERTVSDEHLKAGRAVPVVRLAVLGD